MNTVTAADTRGPSAVRDWALFATMTLLGHPIDFLLGLVVFGAAPFFGVWGLLAPPIVFGLLGLLGMATGHDRLPGRTVRPAEELELAALVRRVAEQLDFRAPLLVRVIPTVDAALVPTRVCGVRAYAILLGFPLLRRLTAAQLAAVVAHEVSHTQHASDRRASLLLGARDSLAASLDNRIRIPAAITGRLLRATQARCWDAELAADADAAAVAGTEAVRGALEQIGTSDAALTLLGQTWTEVLAEDGAYPEDLYDALDAALADPHVWLRAVSMVARDDAVDPYAAASHPPLDTRLAALPERAAGDWDGSRPVRLRATDAVQQWCVRVLVRSEVDRDDLRPARVLDTAAERFAPPVDEARAALIAATGRRSVSEALSTAVDSLADGTWPRLARAVEPEIGSVPRRLRADAGRHVMAGCLGRALSGSLLDAGWSRASRWTASVLVAPDGRVVDVRGVVERAIDLGDSAQVRALLAAGAPAGVA